MRATSGGGTGSSGLLNRTVDDVAPSTGNDAPAGWQSTDVNVTLTPSDARSGVADTLYCVDTANSCAPSTSGTSASVTQAADSEGTQYVRFYSSDNVGNDEAVNSVTVQIDKLAPTDGTLSITPGNNQLDLSWSPATDGGSGLTSPAYKVVRADGTGTPPADCSGAAVYTGDATSYLDTGVSNGTQYAYRVCATDGVGLVSSGTTATDTPAAVCTPATPTVSITSFSQQITSDGGNAVYNIEVTNNDSVDCTDTTFNLTIVNSNANFTATEGDNQITVSPGVTGNSTITVTDTAAANGEATDVYFYTNLDGSHAQSANSEIVTALVNIPGSSATHYNIGETVHFEFQQSGFFNGGGIGALTITGPDGTPVAGFNGADMYEIEDGGSWLLAQDWDTTGEAAGTYTVEILDTDNIPVARTFVTLDNPVAKLTFYVDSGYTTPTDIFADGSIVYVEAVLPASESGVTTSTLNNWDGTTAAQNTGASGTVPATVAGSDGTYTLHYNFTVDFVAAGIGNGDWGYLTFVGTDNSTITLTRPVQRNDAGCGSCTYGTPTVSILTTDQTINTDPGSVDYTVQVVNTDSVACGSTDFDLVPNDSNTTWFNASTFASDPLTVAPGGSANTTMTVSSQAGAPNGQTNLTSFTTAADGNHLASSASNTVTTDINVPDLTKPTVTAFDVPASSTSQTVTVNTLTASDNIGVTGYLITESATEPAVGDPNWTGTAPTTFTVSGDGTFTLYAWAKDAAGNISTSLSDTIDVDATAPTVTDFTTVSTSTSLIVTITQFLASDTVGVTGYLVTESATPPSAGDPNWTGTAPATYTVASDGSYTLYPWAKDALDNISAVYGAPASVTVDTTALDVTSTSPINGAPAAPLNGQVTINFNDNVNCSTVNTTNITSDSPGWNLSTCSGSQAVFNTSGQAYSTLYNVSVTSAVTDDLGNALSPAPYDFSFTTEAEACVYNDPTISIAEAGQSITADDGSVNYTVTVNNNDTGSCGNTTFTLLATENPGTADFTESFPGGATINLAPSANGNLTVTVTAANGTLNGASQTLDFKTDGSADPNHADSNLLSRTTTMAVPCTTAPAVSLSPSNQDITTDGGTADYTVQVQNDNALACGSANFNLVVVDSATSAFSTPSTSAVDPLTVDPGGGTNSTTLTVTAEVGAANSSQLNSYVYTAVNGTIPQSPNSNTVVTTINRPCVRNAPSFSHAVNQNIAPDGTAIYTLTVINNDVDCADTTFDLSIDSEVESNVGTFTLPSTFSSPTVTVASGATNSTVTFTVVANGAGVENDTLTSTLRLADTTNHNGQDQTTAPVTTLKNINPLIHNSLSTGSTKHSGDGGWGIAGGKYGEFTCGTCHVSGSSNVKRIRTTLPNAPDTAKGDFPGAGGAISLLDADYNGTTDVTPADFGDDSTAPRASSDRICEVCHSYDATKAAGVNKHAYDQQVASGHEDGNNCLSCHPHNGGFSKSGASCDSCHAYPPDPADGKTYQAIEGKGAHVKHVNHLTALLGITLDPNGDSYGDVNVTAVCGVCHDMNGATHETGGGAGANRLINFNSSTAFQFGPSIPAYNGVEDVSSATTPKTCSNLSCHFQDTPWWE